MSTLSWSHPGTLFLEQRRLSGAQEQGKGLPSRREVREVWDRGEKLLLGHAMGSTVEAKTHISKSEPPVFHNGMHFEIKSLKR